MSKRDGMDAKIAGGVHGGLQARYHLSGNWDWYVEPKLYLYTDGIDGADCPKRYDVGYGVYTGLTYRFTGLPIRMKSEDMGDNMFIEAAIGTQGDFGKPVRNNLPALQPLGPAASLAIGKWFMPLGWRISGFGGFHYTFNSDKFKSEEAYAGGRAEVLVNLNTLVSPSVDDPRLEVNLSAGYEFGALAHRSSDYARSFVHSTVLRGLCNWYISCQTKSVSRVRRDTARALYATVQERHHTGQTHAECRRDVRCAVP